MQATATPNLEIDPALATLGSPTDAAAAGSGAALAGAVAAAVAAFSGRLRP